jgi:hypothetical protein
MRNHTALPIFSPLVPALIQTGCGFVLLAGTAPVLASVSAPPLP